MLRVALFYTGSVFLISRESLSFIPLSVIDSLLYANVDTLREIFSL